jgi:hypothetical protein
MSHDIARRAASSINGATLICGDDAANMESIAEIIRRTYAERDAAVAELVAMASRAANELAVRGVKCQGLQAALARLEGERE